MTGFDVHAEGTDEDEEAQTHYGQANENSIRPQCHKEHQAYNHNQGP